jgi:hypothetical protein
MVARRLEYLRRRPRPDVSMVVHLAPTDDLHAELGDEAVLEVGELLGGEVVVRAALDHRRQPGVGEARDERAGVLAEVAEVLDHLGGPVAIHTDDVGPHGVEAAGAGHPCWGIGQELHGDLDLIGT